MRHRAGEGDPLAIRADRERIDRAVVAGDLLRLAPRGGDRIEHVGADVVVRLVHPRGGEEERLAVRIPAHVVLAEVALGQLLRLGLVVGDVDGPDVRGARRIAVAGAVESVDGLVDDADVGLVLVVLFLFLIEV